MKVLILGGSGIISSEITTLAISKGYDVTIVNRGKRKEFIDPNAKLVICDLKKESINSICLKIDEQYDTIIDVISYTPDVLKKNLEIAKNRCSQYIFFSTSVVYKSKDGRYSELDSVGNTEWSYSIYKIECEKVLKELAVTYGFSWTIVRPYITYGKSRIPLQFAPLEYFTIINRAQNMKVIPVYDKDTKCTLTYSKDFAIGLVGIINNVDAFNQVFNIVGDYETTWNSVLDYTMKAFNLKYDLIGLDKEQLRDLKSMKGLDASEILGDKGRDMLFDNDKIHNIVPDFQGKTKFHDVLPEILKYFEDPNHQTINYAWDARIDYYLSHNSALSRDQKKRLVYTPGNQATSKDKWTYFFHRHEISYFLFRLYRKLQSILKKKIN